MRFQKTLAVSVSFLLATSPTWAVMHIKPGAYPKAKQDMIHTPSTARIAKFGSLKAEIIGSSSGTKNVAVIIVQFPPSTCSAPCTPSGSHLIKSLSNINTYFQQMQTYYNEVSYGKISLNINFFGPTDGGGATGTTTAQAAGAYTLTNPMEYYGCGDEGVGCPGVNTPLPYPPPNADGDYLIRDALIDARGGHAGSNPTSSDSGGIYDAVIVVHAGNGNETTIGSNGDIWSIFYSQDPVIPFGGGGFTEGDVVPETEGSGIISPLGVMCHEFGHELGLPDEYNTSAEGGTSVVGQWELMDQGPFDGAGANPSHMGIWDKTTLGWATLTPSNQITSSISTATVSMGYIETSAAGFIKILPPNALPQEYFLVEYRSTNSGGLYDKSIPGTGLLVWHIDDSITSTRGIGVTNPSLENTVNTGSPHYGISIVTADGLSAAPGDAGNPYQNGGIFTVPRSNNFAGQPSGVSMLNISGVGTSQATAQVAAFAVSAGQSILKLANYPNPAGKGYAHPSGEGHTTIQFQLARPAQDYSINIYTLSADLVRKVGEDQITVNLNRSGNDKWVYEFVWDLTNGNGAHVAPGVYLYLIRADGLSQTGKAVVIR